jgi:NAD-dependent SIR2 family protein deacetylase
MQHDSDPIQLAAQAIASADTLLITAGAGMGVDSGLPDFRGDKGFWQLYPSYAKQRLTFADLANPTWFFTHPERAWGFYGYRYNLYQNSEPHQGFHILKDWFNKLPKPSFIYTSNVDGHFQKAGFAGDSIYECHGSINHLQCLRQDCNGRIWPARNLKITVDPLTLLAIGELPRCPDCGFFARPNILMFNDWDWLDSRAMEQNRRYLQWKDTIRNDSAFIIELGAGVTISRIRAIGDQRPDRLIRINPRHQEGRLGTISLAMGALEGLTEIDKNLNL